MNNNSQNPEKKPFDRAAYNKEYIKEYRKKNAEKNKAYQKGYQKKNAESIKLYRKEYREANQDKIKECRKQNSEKTRAYQKEYRKKHSKKTKEYQKTYHLLNKEKNKERSRKHSKKYQKTYPERVRNSQKKFYKNNKTKCRKQHSEWWKKRFHSDPLFRLLHNARNTIWKILKRQNVKKTQTTVELIGCAPEFLKKHLESQFTEGMTWENYGYRGWHIDHIIPCSSFDLSDEDQLKQCCHYTNLQPLWWIDNIKKSNKIL